MANNSVGCCTNCRVKAPTCRMAIRFYPCRGYASNLTTFNSVHQLFSGSSVLKTAPVQSPLVCSANRSYILKVFVLYFPRGFQAFRELLRDTQAVISASCHGCRGNWTSSSHCKPRSSSSHSFLSRGMLMLRPVACTARRYL